MTSTTCNTVKVEILRGKHFPQTEDDPDPCTTQVRASIFNVGMTEVIANEVCSSIQEKSNDPFFKDVLSFNIPEGFEDGILHLKVFELSRSKEPLAILFAAEKFQFLSVKDTKEFIISLSEEDPLENKELIRDLTSSGNASADTPSLNMKIHFTKTKVTAGGQDPHADLLIEPTPLKGSHQLVPTDSQYAWLRIVGDKRWCESFRYALVSSWKSRVLSVGEGEKKEKNLPEINSIGDVIYKRWNCRRGHQILTRTRLTAEKFCKGESNLTFTADDERNFRSEAKSRSLILSDMCQTCLKNTDTSKIREWITRLWVIFAVGIDNDPTGTKVLSYDVRKKVHDTVIDQEDAVVIRAALFYFFVPTLPFEYCQKIAEEDYRKEPLPPLEKDSNFDGSITKATPSQKMFALIVMDVLGSLLDTLTEIEVAKVLKAFKPAIVDAHDRISKGVKGGIKERLAGEGQESSDALFYKGDGIHINHLDKYGNRKKQNKFV